MNRRGREYLVAWSRRGTLHAEVERGGDACTRCSEAGSRADGQSDTTSARLETAKTAGEVVETRTTPAYWLGAGEQTPECPNGRVIDADASDTTDADGEESYVPVLCGHSVHKRATTVGRDTVRVDVDVLVDGAADVETRVSLAAHIADDLVHVVPSDDPNGALVLASQPRHGEEGRALGVWAPCATSSELSPNVDGYVIACFAAHCLALRGLHAHTPKNA